MTVTDLIDVAGWDKAKWYGAVQVVALDAPQQPPVLGLLFRDAEAGADVLQQLKLRLAKPGAEKLRIAVVLGRGGRGCKHYAIAIGPDFGAPSVAGERSAADVPDALFVGASRMLGLTRTSEALPMFLEDVEAKGKFILAPALMDGTAFRFCWEAGIECTQLVVRPVEDVALTGDQDAIAARALEGEERKQERSGHAHSSKTKAAKKAARNRKRKK